MRIQLKNKYTLSLKQKILAIVLILLGIRLLSDIPVPFTDGDYLEEILSSNSTLSFYNSMTGGGLGNLSIGTLSITPFITASIIMQLLGAVFPRLHEMQTGMEDERKKIRQATIAFSIVLAAAEAFALSVTYGKQGALDPYAWYSVLTVTACWTGGSAVCALMGAFIQERYRFNGSSLILTVNILSSMLTDLYSAATTLTGGDVTVRGATKVIIYVGFIYLIYCFVVILTQSEKRIPVTHSRKSGTMPTGAQASVLPLKMCPGNVVPVIFASTVMAIPTLFSTLSGSTSWKWAYFFNSSYWFNTSSPVYTIGVALYVFLLFAFTLFYTQMVFNVQEVARNLQKSGAMVQGVRPGKQTADFLQEKLKPLLLIGAAGMSVIAVIPMIISGILGLSDTAYLGTSVIICVGVIIETVKQVQSQMESEKRKNTRYFL